MELLKVLYLDFLKEQKMEYMMAETKAFLMVSHLAAVMVPQKEPQLEKDLALSLG
jgi:hypothetical protein